MDNSDTHTSSARERAISTTLVPTPTAEYRKHRKMLQTTVEPGKPKVQAAHAPIPITGTRLLIWKQDPSVGEIGVRKAFLRGIFRAGPRDARIINGDPGIPPVSKNVFGDFVQTPGTDAFDAVHTFAVVRQTLTMHQRSLGMPIAWQWNNSSNVNPLSVFPHGLPDVMNAFYSRDLKALKFGDFIRPDSTPPERLFTCRSFDIVSHETGHAVLDGLKPNWLLANQPPQTGGMHESFGDLSAIFLTLSQLDQVEAIIAQTKANLHNKNFLADLAEQFGLALGRPNGLRNADNDLKLSEVGNEVHAISQVFTGAIYDILADIFALEQIPATKDDAVVLAEVGRYVLSLVLRAIKAAPDNAATFADVANQMLNIANADGKPVQYRNFIRNRFTVREVLVSQTPLNVDHKKGVELDADVKDMPNAVQDRSTCCGTMQHPEYTMELEDGIDEEIKELRKSFDNRKSRTSKG